MDKFHPSEREHNDSNLEKLFRHVDQSEIIFFNRLLRQKTPPATIQAFFSLYVRGMREQAKAAFTALQVIASRHSSHLHVAPLEWAEWHAKKIATNTLLWTLDWLQQSCDGGPPLLPSYRDGTDWSDKWQAPRLLTMRPVMGAPYVFSECWERLDKGTTRSVVHHYIELFVASLESEIENCVGDNRLISALRDRDRANGSKPQSSNHFRKKTGRPAKLSAEQRAYVREAWNSALKESRSVPQGVLLTIASGFDKSGFPPPAECLPQKLADRIKAHNHQFRHSDKKIQSWIALLRSRDDGYIKGMRKFLSESARAR